MQGALAADLNRCPNVDVVVVYDTNHLSALVFESIGHDSVLELFDERSGWVFRKVSKACHSGADYLHDALMSLREASRGR